MYTYTHSISPPPPHPPPLPPPSPAHHTPGSTVLVQQLVPVLTAPLARGGAADIGEYLTDWRGDVNVAGGDR